MSTELETTNKNQVLAEIPDDLVKDRGRGTENAGDDLRPPRIMICQAGSPQRKMDDAKQIAGLQELDMFNDLTEENYGRGPLKFVVISILKPRVIEFKARAEGGGIKDFNVPINDPRAQWSTDERGERKKPVATLFREFLVWLPDHQEPVVLSMKSSQLSVADQLRRKLKMPLKGELISPALKGQTLTDPPSWARTFTISTVMDKNADGQWGNYSLKQEPGLTPVETREICRQLADSYAGKDLNIPREPEEHDATDFNPAEYEKAATGTDM